MERFKLFNPNPCAARVGDCAVRACAKATGCTWQETYIGIALEGFCHCDMPSSNSVFGAYLQRHGFKRKNLPDGITVKQFAEDHQTGTYVLALNGHTVCVDSGFYWDTWDSGGELIIYFWQKG